QLLPPSSSSSSSPGMSSPCCENGRTLVNPHTGQSVCSCQYPPSLLTYSRSANKVMGLPEPVYPTPPYSGPQGYVPLASDPSAFYPPLNSPYDLKDPGESWRGIGQGPACYPYDPTSMPAYPYPSTYGGMDINSAARRKNATRENTNTLKAWLYEHRKNPYPTKGEKIMLAIITKMTLTQVSTWFANARRRLKKENKMTWSPRNKPGGDNGGDDEDDDDDDDSKDKGGSHDSDDEECKGDKSPKEEKKSCDRETTPPSFLSLPPGFGDNGERQMAPSVSSSSPSSNGHIMTSLTSSNDMARMSGYMTSPNGNTHPNSSTFGGNVPYPSGSIPGTSRLNHHTSEHIGGSSSASSNLPSTSSSFLNRPDSMCSNSNDSGLSDINCGYGGQGDPAKHHLQPGMMDGRPKIWSLAHVATSEAGGYMGNGHHPLMNGNTGGGDIGGNINNNPHCHINNNNNMNKPGMIGSGYGLPPPPPMLPPGTGSETDSRGGFSQRPIADQSQGQDMQHHGPSSCPSPSAAYPPSSSTSMENQWPRLYSNTSSSGPPGPPPPGMMGGAYNKQAPPPPLPPPPQSSMYSHHLNPAMSHMGGPPGTMVGMQTGQIPSESSSPGALYGQQALAGG
ncbi:hypothetical protein EGW08_005580, partial [Elysia chlorotica]